MIDVLAYDLGGSSMRMAIISISQNIKKMVRIPMQIAKNGNGEFEADPQTWWIAFQEACQKLIDDGADLDKVAAIVGCGFTRTQVPIDADGNVVHPAITFQDSRGAGALQHYLDNAPESDSRKGQNLSPYHPIARLLWLKERKPEVWRKVSTVIEPKDYLNLRLTGKICSDRISQAPLFNFFESMADDKAALKILAIDPSICPSRLSPFAEVGRVKTGLAPALDKLAEKPVVCGSTDTWACVLGSGGLNPGAGYGISGTSDVFGIITESKHQCDGLITVQWGPKQWQLGGPSQGAASRLQWAADRLYDRQPIQDVIHNAFNCDQDTPLFLPYLDGERTPFWDSDLRGAFVGIKGSHQAKDFLRAVADGINYLSRIILERAEAAAGVTVDHICFSGGLANNKDLCQLKADILNRPVFVPDARESGLIGSASLAFCDSSAIAEITQKIMSKGVWYSPEKTKQVFLEQRYSIFKEVSSVLEGISHRLSYSANTLLNINNGNAHEDAF